MHNWKWYHLIELPKSFLLKYRWAFTKVTASALYENFLSVWHQYLHHRETYPLEEVITLF